MARPPAARDARRHDLAQAALVARRGRRHARGHPRGRLRRRSSSSTAACGATGACTGWRSALLLVHGRRSRSCLPGAATSRSRTRSSSSQYAKGMAKFVAPLRASWCAGIAARDRPRRALPAPHGRRASCWRLAINCAYGVAQLLAQVGAGVNLDKAVDRAAHVRAGQPRRHQRLRAGDGACRAGSYVSLGVYRVNALALDPNHLGIMLCVPILLLLPFALRARRAQPHGARCSPALLAFFVGRRGAHALALGLPRARPVGLLVLAWPLAPASCSRRARRAGDLPGSGSSASSPRLVALRARRSSARASRSQRQLGQGALPVLRPRAAGARRAPAVRPRAQHVLGLLPVPDRQDELGAALFYIALLDETGLSAPSSFAAVPDLAAACAWR